MKPDAILCADLHLREDQPLCRTDNYFEVQREKLIFLFKLSDRYKCPIICAGDFFHKAKSGKSFEIDLIELLNIFNCHTWNKFYIIPGNHDLPEHNTQLINNSSLGVLQAGAKETFSYFGIPLEKIQEIEWQNKKIGLIHKLIHMSTKEQVINKEGKVISYSARKLLKENPKFDLILSGDNHKTFVEEYEGRLLINPGSMMRMTADQEDHKPCVFLYYTDTNTVEPIYFPIKQDVISRAHIEVKQERDNRMDSFVKRIKDNVEISLSFENNLEQYFLSNNIKTEVKNKVWELII